MGADISAGDERSALVWSTGRKIRQACLKAVHSLLPDEASFSFP